MIITLCKRAAALVVVFVFSASVPNLHAWDHPGHMITAAIAFEEIERTRPDLINKLGLLFLAHPDTAPFWVDSGEAKGKERVRRMFIECARWAIVAKDAPPEAQAAAAARQGKPVGQAIEALTLNNATMANPESEPAEWTEPLD